MIDRRRLLLTAAAGAGVAVAAPAFARSEADDRLDALLNRWFDEDVDSSPETEVGGGLGPVVDVLLEPAVQHGVEAVVGLAAGEGRRGDGDARSGRGGQKQSAAIDHGLALP